MSDLNTLRQLVADVGPDTAQKLLDIFQAGTSDHLSSVRMYIEQGGDLSELRRHAHSLKGLCLTYGAVDGGRAAEDLQDACDANDPAHIKACANTALDVIPKDVEETLKAFKTL